MAVKSAHRFDDQSVSGAFLFAHGIADCAVVCGWLHGFVWMEYVVWHKARIVSGCLEEESGMRDIVLASQSPRRKALMEQVGITCRVCAADIIEDLTQDCALPEAVERLAYAKANAVFAQEREALVIGADTIVVYQDQVLGKPNDAARAKEMLTLLSGKTHQVITAVAILTKERTECFHRISDVRFYELS